MNFIDWNNALARHFFHEEREGKRVFLFCTEELISEIGAHNGTNMRNFIEVLKAGPEWSTHRGVCRKAYDSCLGWRNRQLPYPPFISYLCLFVMAGGHEGEFHHHSYYPRLRKMLGEPPDTGTYPYFDHMLELWDDLERWSVDDRSGELGVFRVFVQGRKIHIGVPLSQTFLTQQELSELPGAFLRAGLDPAAPPSDYELLSAMFLHSQACLRPSTRSLLDPSQAVEPELLATLADTFRDELLDWDGTIPQVEDSESPTLRHASLAICCEPIDKVARRAQFVLRLRAIEGIPDDGLVISAPWVLGSAVHCEPSVSPWSTPLQRDNHEFLSAASIDWGESCQLEDSTGSWQCSFRGRLIHILVSGQSYGIHGLVEVNRLPIGGAFYLLVHSSIRERVIQWGEASCNDFSDLQILGGLRDQWTMFVAQSLDGSTAVPPPDDVLKSPLSPSVQLIGGVRATRGNAYFAFAPPRVQVEGMRGHADLLLNDEHITSFGRAIEFRLPESSRNAGHHELLIRFDGESIRRRLSLIDDFSWREAGRGASFDRFGNTLDVAGTAPSIAGAFTFNSESPAFSFNTLLGLSECRRVFFIGRAVGQIISWPSEPLPETWSPVWAIPMGRKGRVVFCADNPAAADPQPIICGGERSKKRWKEVLWYRRRRIAPPKNQAIYAIWQKYLQVAKHA